MSIILMIRRAALALCSLTLMAAPPAAAQIDLTAQAQRQASPWRVQPYLGVVVDKARLDTAVSGSNTHAMAVTEYRATSDIARPRVVHYNRYISTALNETDGSATATYTNWIEYPVGVRLTASVVTTAAPGAKAVADMGPLKIPRGSRFRVWTDINGPLIHYTGQGGGAAIGSTIAFGAGAQTTPTLGSMVANASGANGYFPIVVDTTSLPTVMLVDDSHAYGIGDTLDLTGYLGYMERYYAGSIGLINGAQAGDSLAKYLTAGNRSMRLDAMQYASDVGINLAGNDISAGVGSSTIIANMTTAAGEVPAGKRKFTTTEFAKPSQTDTSVKCTTVANQTAGTYEANRLAVNVFKLSSSVVDYVIDVEPWTEVLNGSARVWGLSVTGGPFTDDCVHPNRTGYIETVRNMRLVVPYP